MVVGGAVSDLEAGDGVLPALPESLVDPGHDGFIRHLLSVAELLQDVEGVPEGAGTRVRVPPRRHHHHHHQGTAALASSPSHQLPEESQGERSIPCIQVLPSDPHQGELGLGFAQFNGVVAVLQLQCRCGPKLVS